MYQDLDQFLNECWGWPQETSGALWLLGSASNVAIGNNPPYSISDFLSYHPQFSGTPVTVQGTLDGTTGIVTSLSGVAGLAPGQLVAGPGIQAGSLISSLTPGPLFTTATTVNTNVNIVVANAAGVVNGAPVSGPGIQAGSVVLNVAGNTLTLSEAATATGTNIAIQIGANPSMTLSLPTLQAGRFPLQVFTCPLIPAIVLKAYINIASASVQQARWLELWYFAMGLYVAHYAELFLKAYAGGAGASAGRVAEAGLALGVKTSKSAGDVSAGMTALPGLEDWGAYQLTIYGQQFATFAKGIGSGGMLLL